MTNIRRRDVIAFTSHVSYSMTHSCGHPDIRYTIIGVCVCVCVLCTYVGKHTYIHIHTRIHTHIYIYIPYLNSIGPLMYVGVECIGVYTIYKYVMVYSVYYIHTYNNIDTFYMMYTYVYIHQTLKGIQIWNQLEIIK